MVTQNLPGLRTYSVTITGPLSEARASAGCRAHHPMRRVFVRYGNVHATLRIDRAALDEWWSSQRDPTRPGTLLWFEPKDGDIA